ncbi:leucine-rich repeat domain-containing protein [uncultured Bacteroides sp.]|uniref:leucine-rich repeat domain-containing protein n=1 Tax=uncultured Bacteroides sp. TaxID=162156 RepID=UPI00261F9F73|nr:leucine-rich repeat domain-containing protein [uncultured Bacteroides sp.]
MNAKHYYLSVLLLLVATLGLRAQSKTVTLTEAGTLSNFISEAEQTTITDLTIKGPINSADIITLRGMAGNLKVLNLLDANIVYSAQSYYGGDSELHTQNDVVGDYMFYGLTQLTKITLPKDVWSIGTWSSDDPWYENGTKVNGQPRCHDDDYSAAFQNCVNLQEVVLPAGLLWIGPGSFAALKKLTTVNLPEGLEGIGAYAFKGCVALESIALPASLGTLTKLTWYDLGTYFATVYRFGYNFQGCTKLSKVKLADGLKQLTVNMFNGCTALKSITLPDGMTHLSSAFTGCSALQSLSIPSTVIMVRSFEGCSSLKELVIPDGVTELSTGSFSGCTSLTKITLPAELQSIPEKLFEGCSSLTSLTIPDKVMFIGKNAFEYCTALESVSLPSDLATINGYAFSGCKALKAITIPQSVSVIGQYAFNNCSQLTSIKLPPALITIDNYTFQGCENLETVQLPAGLITINQNAFSGCKKLKKITIPGAVQTINEGAFANCGLQEVVLSEGLISLANGSFAGCNLLEKVTFPTTMKTISGFNNTGLKTIAFAEGAEPEAIGYEAFAGCDSLRTITLPSSIKTIGYNAFLSCDTLQSVNIPEGVTTLYGGTFKDCRNLTSLTLPASLTEITQRRFEGDDQNYYQSSPFAGCIRLENIDVSKAKLATLYGEIFNGLPVRSLDLSAATLKNIPSSMCTDCDSLRTVKLPDSIEEMGNKAFYSCDSLKNITLPSSLQTIGGQAFYNCKSLTITALPSSLQTIGDQVFYNCGSLTITALPSSLQTIGVEAFYCVQFPSLSMPEGVTTIAERAFRYAKFGDLTIPSTVTTVEQNAFQGAEVKGTLTFNPGTSLTLGNDAFYCEENWNSAYHLGVVNWNSSLPFEKEKFCRIDNLYLPEGGKVTTGEGIGYIFYNGITDSVAVNYTYNNGRNAYEVKQPMKTRKVTYEKRFNVTSGFGEAAGWKTLVLPFAPTKITHTRGYGESQETVTLAPFGSTALETEGVLPFWLYELGTDGNYKAATAIEANKAYLICMPNNDAYPSENNISGDVLFMAEDATNGITLGVTEGALKPSTGTKFDLVPTYEQVAHGLNVYTLNEDNYYYADDKTYPNGSVFVQDYEDVYPFEAYLVSKEAQAGTLKATRYYAIGGGDGTITGIEDGPAMPDQATRAYSRGGVLYIQTNADRTIYIYNVQGQTVRIVNAHEGLNEVRGLEEGIYMLEGQKVVVK